MEKYTTVEQKKEAKKVIVCYGYGSFSVYDGTLENAKKILNGYKDYLNKTSVQIAEEGLICVTKESIMTVLNKILTKPIGEMASKTIQVTDENKQEVIMYCFKNGITIHNENGIKDEYTFFKTFKVEDFSFFRGHKSYPVDAMLIDEYVAEQAKKYKVIKNDIWREGAKEESKIRYILDLVGELCHRDEKYDVVDFQVSA